jgi:hypothetical protein
MQFCEKIPVTAMWRKEVKNNAIENQPISNHYIRLQQYLTKE